MSIVNVGIQFGTLLLYLKAKNLDKVIIAQGTQNKVHIKIHINYQNISYMFECRGGWGAGRNVVV